MDRFTIRDGRSQDKEAIGALWLELMQYHRSLDPRFTIATDGQQKYVRHAQEMMRSRNSRVLVACEGHHGEVIGYLMGELQYRPPISIPGLYGFISDIYVREAWRKHQVGSALFAEMRRWFVDRNATAIELFTSEANPVANAFWQSLGLEPFLKLLHLDL